MDLKTGSYHFDSQFPTFTKKEAAFVKTTSFYKLLNLYRFQAPPANRNFLSDQFLDVFQIGPFR